MGQVLCCVPVGASGQVCCRAALERTPGRVRAGTSGGSAGAVLRSPPCSGPVPGVVAGAEGLWPEVILPALWGAMVKVQLSVPVLLTVSRAGPAGSEVGITIS